MRLKINRYIVGLIPAVVFFACENDGNLPEDSTFAYIEARIAGQGEADSRATADLTNGTYTAFVTGDQIGLYTDDGYGDAGSLKTNPGMEPVKNSLFTLGANGKWQDTPLLKWDKDQGNGEAADIYGYYPYQTGDFSTGGYTIFTGTTTNKLEDVLVAERIRVENDNPAIFLTFKHRFALLKLELGTGFEGSPEDADGISVSMSHGIADNAKMNKGTINLRINEYGIKEFKPIKTNGSSYYIIVPVGEVSGTDSLRVASINIDGTPFSFEKTFAPYKNTIYNVTVHKGEQGSVTIAMGGIEEWGSDRYLSNIREEAGVYWVSDVINLIKALNGIADKPTENHAAALASWGTWDDDKGCFVFPVMRNIDMTETTEANRNLCITDFYDILEGNGFYINGLDIKGAGFIGTLKEGAVNNLELRSIAVDNGASTAGTGALAGTVENGSTLYNCSVTGVSAVVGGDNTGGLVGKGNLGIDRCSVKANVTGGDNTGGLIGALEAGGSISRSYTVGVVEATGNSVGGLAGSAAGAITNSHAGCNVKGVNNVGGLVGSTTNRITGCTATGAIAGSDIVGGLVGVSTSLISQSGANGSVTGTGIAGGLIGEHCVADEVVIAIEQSYSRSVTTGTTTGGLIGHATKPYQAAVYEMPESIEVPDDPDDPDPDDPEEPEPEPEPVLKTPEQGTVVKNCYATNGIVLIQNTTGGITYSYQVVENGNVDMIEGAYYTLPLTITSEEVDRVIAELNEPGQVLWIKGFVMINGVSYMLPVIN